MSQNPSWPLFEEAVGFLNSPSTSLLAFWTGSGYKALYNPAEGGLWCDLTSRTQGSWTSRRGRQYELDQVQTGTVTSTMRNLDGALDPSNTASPFYPNVRIYRAYRRRAQSPLSANLLYRDTAAGYGSYGFGLPSWTSINTTYPVFPNGASVPPLNTVPTTVPVGTSLQAVGGFAIIPGATYSGQTLISTASGSAAGITMQAQFNWYLSDGTVTTTTGPSVACGINATAKLTVTGTAPTNAVGATLSAIVAAAPTATVTIQYFWQWQVELGNAPTSYVQPTWYDLFTGYVERWPQTWTHGGTFGTSQLQAVDAFGYLTQSKILSPGYMEILAVGASWLWPMDEPSGSTAWLDLTGNSLPASPLYVNGATATQIQAGQSLPTSTTGGASGTISWAGNGFNPASVSGPCTKFANYNTTGAALLDIGTAKGTVGPPASSGWTMVFLVNTPLSTSNLADQTIWAAYDTATNGSNQLLQLRATSTGFYKFDVRAASGTLNSLSFGTGNPYSGLTANDGSWHLLVVQMSADGKTLTGWLDGFTSTSVTSATDMRPTFPSASRETIGGRTGLGVLANGWTGYLSVIGYVPSALPATAGFGADRIGSNSADNSYDPPSVGNIQYTLLQSGTGANVTQLGLSGAAVPSSGNRYRDVLRWANWQGLRAVDSYLTAQTQDYGAPSEMLASASSGGTDAVSALQTVVDTDNGEHYVDRSGKVVFHRRGWRYARTSPTVTFGEVGTNNAATRTNIVTNPSFEAGLTGWSVSGGTITRDTTTAYVGSASLRLDTTAASQLAVTANGAFPATVGSSYTLSAYIKGTGTCRLALVSSLNSAFANVLNFPLTGSWQRISCTGVVPSGATGVGVWIMQQTAGTNSLWADGVMIEQTSSLKSYFDGNTAEDLTYTYGWTGTPNNSTSQATPQPNEVPYLGAGFDFDPTRVADDVQLTQTSSGITYRQIDATAIDRYGDIQLQRNVNTLTVLEIQDGLKYLLLANADPNQRVQSITIDVGANPSMWTNLLQLELGTPVALNRRPPNAPWITFDGFVEQISWSISDQGAATCSLQLSPNLPLLQNAVVSDTSRFCPAAGAMTVTCAATDGTINVTTVSGPTFTTSSSAYPLDIVVDSERITLSAAPSGSTSPQSFTVVRGVNGTTAAAHSSAAVSLAQPSQFAY